MALRLKSVPIPSLLAGTGLCLHALRRQQGRSRASLGIRSSLNLPVCTGPPLSHGSMTFLASSITIEQRERKGEFLLDIHEYLERIDYRGPLEPTLQTLQALHEAHMLAIPFENLSIHYAQPILLDEEALFHKIVHQQRGGFCYELNGLFAWLLRQLGFQVTLLSAGVCSQSGDFGPEFDHLTLLIHQLGGSDWLADVGFGDSFRRPLRFEAALEQKEANGQTYRLQRIYSENQQQEDWILQQLSDEGWESQYRFSLQSHVLSDFTAMCHYQQTSPESHFTQKRICSLATPTGRISLSDLLLITATPQGRTEQLLANEEEYSAALAKYFHIYSI